MNKHATNAAKTGDAKAISEAMTEARKTAEMWGVDL